MYGMLEFVVLTVFIAGLMVGRTPEYLGKKIERREVQFAMLALLVVPLFTLDPDRHRVGHERRARDAQQQRSARVLRDPLRVHVGDRQQRLGVRRA